MEKYGDVERVKRALKHKYESTTLIYAMADELLSKRLKTREKRKGRKT
jgi:hypothetical protein